MEKLRPQHGEGPRLINSHAHPVKGRGLPGTHFPGECPHPSRREPFPIHGSLNIPEFFFNSETLKLAFGKLLEIQRLFRAF
jgi:hypothetical protein